MIDLNSAEIIGESSFKIVDLISSNSNIYNKYINLNKYKNCGAKVRLKIRILEEKKFS